MGGGGGGGLMALEIQTGGGSEPKNASLGLLSIHKKGAQFKYSKQ